MIGFYVNGDYIKNCKEGVVDTGTSFLIANTGKSLVEPSLKVNHIKQKNQSNSDVFISLVGSLPRSKCYTMGFYSATYYCRYNPLVDVEYFPKISIYTLGVKFVLNASDYLIPDPVSILCFYSIILVV